MATDGTKNQIKWDKIGGEWVKSVNANLPAGQQPLSLETESTDENPAFIDWLCEKQGDARDNWFRFNKLAHDEKLIPERFEALKDRLRLRYARYFADIIGVSDAFKEDIDQNIGTNLEPWDDALEKKIETSIMQLKIQTPEEGFTKCTTCRQTLPVSRKGRDARAQMRCGVCDTDIDHAELNTYSVVHKKTFDCKQCCSRICATCTGPDTDFECSKCDRIIGLKPKEIVGDPTYRCWGCFTDQTAAKLEDQSISMPFCVCRKCSRNLCLRCAKPLPDHPESPPKPRPLHKFLSNMEAGDPAKAYSGYSLKPGPLKEIRPTGIMFESFRRNNESASRFIVGQHKTGSAPPVRTTSRTNAPNAPVSSGTPKTNQNGEEAQTPGPQELTGDDESTRGGLLKYVDGLVDTLLPIKNYPGSESWKRKAHRRGYVDKKLTDLYKAPKVAQVDFGTEICPQVGFEDAWYAISNSELYDQAAALVADCFCTHDFPKSYQGSVWLEDLGPQFIRYADMVAHGDILMGGYENILRNRTQRKFLLVGILAQIIVRKIYSELLFGATPKQQLELERQDRHCINGDGYKRTATRANYINLLLEHKLLPDNFWPEVDSLAASTTAIFVPLLNLLNYFNPPSQDSVDLLKVFDGIHKLIAHAAYYSICMRRSNNSVFFITSAYPNARRDYETERDASPELYQECLERASRDAQAWRAKKAALQDQWGDLPADVAAAANLRLEMAAHYRTRGSKVKFAVWPRIVRWRAENVGQRVRRMRAERLNGRPRYPPGFTERYNFVEASSQAEVESGEGQRAVDIGRAMVVYYQGYIFPRPSADAGGGGSASSSNTRGIDGCCGGADVVVSAEVPGAVKVCAGVDDEVFDDGPRLLTYIEDKVKLAEQQQNLHWRWLRLVVGLTLGFCALLYHQEALQVLHDGIAFLPFVWSRILKFALGLDGWVWLVLILLALPFAVTRRLLVGVTAIGTLFWTMVFVRNGAPARFAAIARQGRFWIGEFEVGNWRLL